MTQTIGGAVLAGAVLLAAGRTGAGLLVLALAVLVAVLVVKAKAITGRRAAGHGHGAGRVLLRHEGGHVTGAKSLGQFRKARVGRHDGFVTLRAPGQMTPAQYMAFMKVGEKAARTSDGCSADRAAVREEKARMRRAGATGPEIRKAERVAEKMATRWASSPDVDRWADRLDERRRL